MATCVFEALIVMVALPVYFIIGKCCDTEVEQVECNKTVEDPSVTNDLLPEILYRCLSYSLSVKLLSSRKPLFPDEQDID